jgi:hypothetical protein
MLDTCIVDEDVDPAVCGNGVVDEALRTAALNEVRTIVRDFDAVGRCELVAGHFDGFELAQTIDDKVGAGCGKGVRNAQTDTTCGPCDDRNAPSQILRRAHRGHWLNCHENSPSERNVRKMSRQSLAR